MITIDETKLNKAAVDNADKLLNTAMAKDYWNGAYDGFIKGAKWQAEQFNLSDMKSPFTGGRVFLKEEPTEVVFRGETLTINRKCYQCEDTGKQFTNEELDSDNQWATFRAYWKNKGFEHFYDIDNYEGR